MDKQDHKIFKRSFVEKLRMEVNSGKGLKDYFQSYIHFSEEETIPATLSTEGKIPMLNADSDVENAIRLYEYFKPLNETQASDPRFWTYLSHATFRSYVLKRWGIKDKYEDVIKDPILKQKAINSIIDHWFISGNDRALRRHALARLWWAAHMTIRPWESEPEYFSTIVNEDPYAYLKVLFSAEDIFQSILERKTYRDKKVFITLLEFLKKNPDVINSRDLFRELMKEMNLVSSTKRLSVIPFGELYLLIESLTNDLKNDFKKAKENPNKEDQ